MGTRGSITFVANGEAKTCYNHFDSYPEGLGVEMLRFARRRARQTRKLKADIMALTVVTDDTPITPEIEDKLAKWTDRNVGGRMTPNGFDNSLNWYQLLRDTQGDPDAILTAGFMEDASEFPFDSLFCEYSYVIDADARTFEVYKGFQTKAHAEGRFAAEYNARPTNPLAPKWTPKYAGDKQWYPVRLIASWGLDDLPTLAEWEIELGKIFAVDEARDVLGVDEDATPAQIKAAYRSRSKDVHPDRNPSEDAEEDFRALTDAMEMLLKLTSA